MLPITFPVSLVVFVLGAVVSWMRSRGLWMFILGFMVIWTAYGQLTVLVDSAAGDGPTNAIFTRHPIKTRLDVTPYHEGYIYNNPSWTCDPGDQMAGNWGGWPFGKTYVWVLACDAVIAREMLTRTGFRDQAQWVVRQYEITLVDYLVDRRISSSYLFMGGLALIEVFVTIPWVVGWSIVQVARHLRWE